MESSTLAPVLSYILAKMVERNDKVREYGSVFVDTYQVVIRFLLMIRNGPYFMRRRLLSSLCIVIWKGSSARTE
jgi:hypothetical protein